MPGFGGAVKLTGESEYRKALNQITQNLKEVGSEMKVVSTAFAASDKSTTALTAKTEVLNKQLAEQTKKLDLLKANYDKMAAAYRENTAKHEKLVASYEAEKKKLDEIEKTCGKASKEYQEQKAKVEALAGEVKKSTTAQEANEKAMSKMRVEINNAQADVNKTTQELSSMEKELDSSGKDAEELGKKTEESGKKTEEAGNKFAGFGKAAAVACKAAVDAMVAVSKAAIDAGKKIWSMANDVSAAGDEIDKNSQKIGISREAYQEWSYVFERSGANIDGLQKGMKKLSGVITDAAGGSKSAAEKLAAVGLSIDDLNGKSQEEQLSIIVSALQGMEEGAGRTAAATDLLGNSAVDMAAVLNTSAEATQELIDEAHKYGMIMSDEAVDASAAFDNSLTKMKNTMGGLKNQMVGQFLPGLTQIMDGFSDLAAGEEGASETIKAGFAGIIKSLTAMIPQAVSFITTLASAVLECAPEIIKSLASGVLDAIPQLLPTIVEVVTSIISTIVDLLPEILNTGIQILLELIDGIMKAIPDLVKMLPEIIQTIVTTLTDNLPEILQMGLDLLTTLIQGIVEAIPDLVAMLPDIIMTIVNTLGENLPTIIQTGVELLLALVSGLVEALPQLIEKLPELIVTVVTVLLNNLPVLVEGALKLFLGLVTGFAKMIPTLIKKLPEAVKAVLNGLATPLKNLFSNLWKSVKDVFAPVVKWFGDIFSKAWEAIKKKFASWGEFWSGLWTKIKEKFSSIGTAVGDAISGAVKKGVNFVFEKIENIINGGIKLINGAIKLINKIPGVNIGYIDKLSLPRLAKGGVVDRPTLAELGEDGREAIVPLENNTGWIKKISHELRASLKKEQLYAPKAGDVDQKGYSMLVRAFKDAMSGMKVEMDDRQMGRFIEDTVSRAIYT